jgi:hypothetical protein
MAHLARPRIHDLKWVPTTELEITGIENETCSHARVTRLDESRIR